MQIPVGVASCQAVSDAGTFPGLCAVGRDVAWDLGALAGGASRTVSMAFGTAAAAQLPDGTIIHTTARARDGAGDSAHAAASTAVGETAPLMLAIADDADPVRVGDMVEYTVRFGNRSAASQANGVLTVTLPAGLTAVTASDDGMVDGAVVTWDLGTLAPGVNDERSVTASVSAVSQDPLVRLTRAALLGGTGVAHADELTAIATSLPLHLTIAAMPDPVGRNAALTYQLTVTNNGPGTAAVQIRMQIPVGVASCGTPSDSGTFPGLCAVGRDVAWSLPALAEDASKTVSVAFQTPAAVSLLPNGTIIHVVAQARDGAANTARAARSVGVMQ
jgi:uncharacterized repeat protein (TIGR01451 family)